MNYLICEYSVDDLYPVQSVRLDTLYDTYAWMTPEKLMAAWEALISEPVIDTIVFGLRETIDVRENAPGTVLVKRCKPIRLVTREEDGP